MRVVIVGEAPSRRGCPPFANGSGSGARLCKLLDVTEMELRSGFELHNLYSLPRGRPFDRAAARRKALEFPLGQYDAAVLAGRQVARAFGPGEARFFELVIVRGVPTWVIPHPSGRNRWWNVELNERRALRFFRTLRRAMETLSPEDLLSAAVRHTTTTGRTYE